MSVRIGGRWAVSIAIAPDSRSLLPTRSPLKFTTAKGTGLGRREGWLVTEGITHTRSPSSIALRTHILRLVSPSHTHSH